MYICTKQFNLFFTLFLSFAFPSFGSRWAEGENCYYHLEHGRIVRIERGTEKMTSINLKGNFTSIHYHKGSLYLSTHWGCVYSFNPESGEKRLIFRDEEKETALYKYIFWKDCLIFSIFNIGKILKIDLNSSSVTSSLKLGAWIKRGYIYGDLGCFALDHTEHVVIVDLDTFIIKAKVLVGRSPKHMVGVGDRLYVSCQESGRVAHIDLKKNELLGYINVERLPTNLIVVGNHLYVLNRLSESISDVNLKTNTVVQTISLKDSAGPCLGHPLVIKNGIGYITRALGREVLFIDMVRGKILLIHRSDKRWGLCVRTFVTDTAFYIKGQRICPLYDEVSVFLDPKLPLFTATFDVVGITLDDGENDYEQMLKAISFGNYEVARTHLISSLRCANPKAYAVAAYAYLHGTWGCTSDLGLHVEYSKGADQTVYKELCTLCSESERITEKPIIINQIFGPGDWM